MLRRAFLFVILIVAVCSLAVADGVPVKLASLPTISPDGSRLVFEFNRDLWSVSSAGGSANPLTQHAAFDTRPVFSPDGSRLAFSSNRDDSWQVFVMPSEGGTPRQVTFHSEGSNALDWYPDGERLLVRGARAQRGYMQFRFFDVSTTVRRAEKMLFDAYGMDADLSHDGRRLLFTRFGDSLYRKGYRGSAASQIWMFDLEDQSFRRVCNDPSGSRSPLWKPDGEGFYYVSERDGCFNLWEHDLKTGREKQLTFFDDASVILPGISADGSTIIFRQLFDFYRLDPRDPSSLTKLDITVSSDGLPDKVRRRWYTKAWNNDSDGTADFSDDALEVCFTAGGDLYVMDTVLREPKLVCGQTATHEREAIFGPNGDSIYFLRDNGLAVDIWKAERMDASKYWWQNDEFKLTQLTDDRLYRYNLSLSPAGDRISVVQGSYELWHYDLELEDGVQVSASTDKIYYDWAPDGNWLAVSQEDSWGNSDVWIMSAYNSRAPYNLSRHPNWDANARWSPDGRKIVFTGKRYDGEIDIFYVYLRKSDELRSERDRKLREAIENMEKQRGAPPEQIEEVDPSPPDDVLPEDLPPENTAEAAREQASSAPDSDTSEENSPDAGSEDRDLVEIDFEGLSRRIHRLSLPGSTPSHLFWSFDSKALAFQSTIGGKRGTYKVHFEGSMKPELISTETGTGARWIKDGSRILWLSDRIPAIFKKKLDFEVYQETDIPEYKRLAFRLAWRNLRDRFYDPALNNRDWEEIRLKYEDMAAQSSSWDAFERVIEMLCGELNASHLGFTRSGSSGKEWYDDYSSGQWRRRTAHLGLVFDREWSGPGLKVAYVVPGGPSDSAVTEISPGDVIKAIDGVAVDPVFDLTKVLNGRHGRAIELTVDGPEGLRTVVVDEKSYDDVRDLIREDWLASMESKVDDLSGGSLGYLNIEKMNRPSLRRFEREVFARGMGREGLIIDVRNNGGGFIADHLLSVLCHPEHAFTIPRGGSVSYQQSYLDTAFYSKPIVVLCNQYSASNAEIFCHAIQTMGRGQIVGVPTKGAVISTPKERILDIGTMQMPTRGWFLPGSGLDMEIQPCVPEHIVELSPGDVSSDRDPQLEKAVEVLLQEAGNSEPQPDPVYASELRMEDTGTADD